MLSRWSMSSRPSTRPSPTHLRWVPGLGRMTDLVELISIEEDYAYGSSWHEATR